MMLAATIATAALNLVAWAFFTGQLRRQIRNECMHFRALGWTEHREQVLAKNKRQHPRAKSGQYTQKGGK